MASGNKYHAKKVVVDGRSFDSKKEANRYKVLSALQANGEIQNLQCQVKYELVPAQYEESVVYTPKQNKPKNARKVIERKVEYVADFVYEQDGKTVVEDVKGFRNSAAYSIFVIKRKLMLQVHGIKVREI